MTDTKLRANVPPSAQGDPVHACFWCGKALRSCRADSVGRFCCATHRNSYWTACRKLGDSAVALGILSIEDLKADPAACTHRWKEKAPPPCPETGTGDQRSPEPLKRFAVEVPQGLLMTLVFRLFEIRFSEQDDLPAIMGALTRLRHKPKISETSGGVKLLTFPERIAV